MSAGDPEDPPAVTRAQINNDAFRRRRLSPQRQAGHTLNLLSPDQIDAVGKRALHLLVVWSHSEKAWRCTRTGATVPDHRVASR